jgi:predicted nucleic acid-binding protein
MLKAKLLDSTPIINFNSRMSRPDLLFLFITYGFLLETTEAVVEEISKGFSKSFLLESIKNNKIKLNSIDLLNQEKLKAQYPFLGSGEISILCCALILQNQYDEVTCIFDDRLANRTAKELNLSSQGTCNLLKELVKSGDISKTEFYSLVDKLILNGFFLKKSDIYMLLEGKDE